MEEQASWLLVALGVVGAAAWSVAVRRRVRVQRAAHAQDASGEAAALATISMWRDVHVAVLYLGLAGVGLLNLQLPADQRVWSLLALLPAVSMALSLLARGRWESRATIRRLEVERLAEQTVAQEGALPTQLAALLVPTTLADLPGVETAIRHLPGEGVTGGDFVDVLPLPGGRVAFVVGDVAGHGLGPALTALRVKGLLAAEIRRFRDPAQAFEELNRQLYGSMDPDHLVSASIVVLDLDAGTMRHASAGHPAVFCHFGREVRLLRATGPLLFLQPDGLWASRELPLAPREAVVLVSDGLVEVRDGRVTFGEERVAGTIRRSVDLGATRIAGALVEAAVEFGGGAPRDDLTVVVVQRT